MDLFDSPGVRGNVGRVDEDYVPVGSMGGPAQDRAWIQAQLVPAETLRFSRPVLDLSPARWKLWDRTESYAVVTERRVFVAAITGAYKGRRGGLAETASSSRRIAREAALDQIERLSRRSGERTVWVRLGGDARRLQFLKPDDASDFEKALTLPID
jgi:hypothetical protein